MTYSKPHFSYIQPLELLKSRGVEVDNESEALRILESVGYYRFSGYLYPYRMRNSTGDAPLDHVAPGTTFTDVYNLLEFDRNLRNTLLDGVLQVEVAVRARIAYILGKRDPFGHLNQASLDGAATSRIQVRRGVTKTQFDWWLEEYERLLVKATTESYVKHNLNKYGPPLPVWVACEFFDFGAVTRLLQFLPHQDRQTLAATAGIGNELTLRSWMTTLNYVRNVCAHNSRLWNRGLVQRVMLRKRDLPPDLRHLARVLSDRLYPVVAITAYLTNRMAPEEAWVVRMVDALRSFPTQPLRSIQEMGVPARWETETLWVNATKKRS